jgi:hypothetical protein
MGFNSGLKGLMRGVLENKEMFLKLIEEKEIVTAY